VIATDQLILEFEHRPSLSGEDFLISDENREAVAWIDKWPNWPSPLVVIHGPPGCGKTHLCEVFRAKASATGLAPGLSRDLASVDRSKAFVFDGLDRFMGGDVEEEIFHFYNALRAEGGHLLATATLPPPQWPFSTPDVRSRIQASPSATIVAPGDGLIAGLLVKLALRRSKWIPKDMARRDRLSLVGTDSDGGKGDGSVGGIVSWSRGCAAVAAG